MSKPLTHSPRLHLVSEPSVLIRNIGRMAMYWFCVTILLWSQQHPITEWQPQQILLFLVASSIIVPALGGMSAWMHGKDANTTHSPDKTTSSLTYTLMQTAMIAVDVFVVVLVTVVVGKLLF